MNIAILYEDEDLLIIDKPAGITVNNSETTRNQITVQDWVIKESKIKNIDLGIDKDLDFYKRAGIVHRLDKETSGILIIAKNNLAFENIQRQFKDRVVKKTYLALAHGKIVPLSGEIDVPVGRLPWNRKQFGIFPGGRESKTLYQVKKYYKNSSNKELLTLVELYPQSGRTHQIRVHLKYIGHSIFSDFLYAGRKTAKNDRKLVPRVFLHAARISFSHPSSGKLVRIESLLPPQLQEFLDKAAILEI